MRYERRRYEDRIIQDSKILVGKPVIKGTGIPVELVLGHLAANRDLTELFATYPRLTIEDVQACLAYAETLVRSRGRRAARKVSSSAPSVHV
jgi:uncharacterized protein (DUF433 family)